MGGNALKIETVRLDKKEFLLLENEVVSILKRKFEIVKPTIYYKDKESFGDLDILVPRPIPFDILEWLVENFKTEEISYDGKLLNAQHISFEYKKFQIDLIFTIPDNINISHFYYSYNDLNNYVGRIADAFGCKFGFNGLYYICEENQHKRFLLSTDPEKIYNFLGFNYNTYLKGFNNLNEIFDYVILSKYFHTDLFKLENLNHINRTRNLKRPNYSLFLEYLEKNNIKNGYCFENDKSKYLDKIISFFPEANLKWKLNEHQNYLIRQEKIKKLLNSLTVKEILNIEDWSLIRSVIDQIYVIPDIDRKIVGFKEEEILYLIKKSYDKVLNTKIVSFLNKEVLYRSQNHEYFQGKVVNEDDKTVLILTEDFFYETIEKNKVKLIENWINL